MLQPYLKSTQILACPSNTGNSNTQLFYVGGPTNAGWLSAGNPVSYRVNAHIVRRDDQSILKMAAIDETATRILASEGTAGDSNNGYVKAYLGDPYDGNFNFGEMFDGHLAPSTTCSLMDTSSH